MADKSDKRATRGQTAVVKTVLVRSDEGKNAKHKKHDKTGPRITICL